MNDDWKGTDQSSSMPNPGGGEEDSERQRARSTNARIEHNQNNVDQSYLRGNQDGLNLISSLAYQLNNNNNSYDGSQQFMFHHNNFPPQSTATSAPASYERMDESSRERRLAQNRRTAQARRDRNKAYLETLQQTHNDLLHYNKILLEDNAALKIHHANLLAQVNDVMEATNKNANPNATDAMNLQQQENQTLNSLSLLLQNLNDHQSSSQIDLAAIQSSFANNNANDQDSQLQQQLQNQMTGTTETNRGEQTITNLLQNFTHANAMTNQVPIIPRQSDETNQRQVGGESHMSNYAVQQQQPGTAALGSTFDEYMQATSILSRLHYQQQQLQHHNNYSISSTNQLHQLQVGQSPWVQNLAHPSAAASAATYASESSSSALRRIQNQDQIIQNQSNSNMNSETSSNSNNAANPLSLFLSGNLPHSPTERQKKE